MNVIAIGESMNTKYPLAMRLNWRSRMNVVMWFGRYEIHNPEDVYPLTSVHDSHTCLSHMDT